MFDLPDDEQRVFFAELDACLPLVRGWAEAWDGAFAMAFGVDEGGLPRLRELRIGDGVLSSVAPEELGRVLGEAFAVAWKALRVRLYDVEHPWDVNRVVEPPPVDAVLEYEQRLAAGDIDPLQDFPPATRVRDRTDEEKMVEGVLANIDRYQPPKLLEGQAGAEDGRYDAHAEARLAAYEALVRRVREFDGFTFTRTHREAGERLWELALAVGKGQDPVWGREVALTAWITPLLRNRYEPARLRVELRDGVAELLDKAHQGLRFEAPQP